MASRGMLRWSPDQLDEYEKRLAKLRKAREGLPGAPETNATAPAAATLRGKAAEAARGVQKKPPKYRNRKVEEDGHIFDSKKERDRYRELMALHLAGRITAPSLQVRIRCEVNGVLVCSYVADFTYHEIDRDGRPVGQLVVEDVKSAFTRKLPVYRLKKKLVAALHGVQIREV